MNTLLARAALVTMIASAPALVLAGEAGKDEKKPAEKADGKKAAPKKETKEEKKAPAPSGSW
jgi:hypothetical protein